MYDLWRYKGENGESRDKIYITIANCTKMRTWLAFS